MPTEAKRAAVAELKEAIGGEDVEAILRGLLDQAPLLDHLIELRRRLIQALAASGRRPAERWPARRRGAGGANGAGPQPTGAEVSPPPAGPPRDLVPGAG